MVAPPQPTMAPPAPPAAAPRPQPIVHQYNGGGGGVHLLQQERPAAGGPPGPSGQYGMTGSTLNGTGVLTWLSPKAGILSLANGGTVSFQTNEFCDRNLHDLTASLRVGFTLKFSAIHTQQDQYTAICVGPVFGEEAKQVFRDAQEINLHPTDESKPRGMHEYSVDLELAAYQMLLAPFEKQCTPKLQLSSLHSQIANTDESLFRYVGSSAMKRRLFVERRTHIFCLNSDDSIVLQNPAIYRVISLLSSYLLCHGGVTAIEDLFSYFATQDDDPVTQSLPKDRPAFMALLTSHSFMFSVFPNRAYVAVRRALPNFDYPGFIAQYFPDLARRYASYGVQKLMSINTGHHGYGSQGYHHRHAQQYGHHNQYHQQQYHHHHHQNYRISPEEQEYYDDGYGYQEEYHEYYGYQNGHHHVHQQSYARGGGAPSSMVRSTRSSQLGSPPDAADIWAPRPKEAEYFHNEGGLSRDFGSLLSLSSAGALATKNAQVQKKEEQRIGQPNCTCKCSCGAAAKSKDENQERWLPANFFDSVKEPSTSVGTIGQNRPSGTSSSSNGSNSEKPKPTSEPFNLFGVNDVLGGHFDALRFGQL